MMMSCFYSVEAGFVVFAIANAILSATPNACGSYCWKGHESYQDIQGINMHLDDKERGR